MPLDAPDTRVTLVSEVTVTSFDLGAALLKGRRRELYVRRGYTPNFAGNMAQFTSDSQLFVCLSEAFARRRQRANVHTSCYSKIISQRRGIPSEELHS